MAATPTATSVELLQAHAELWCHSFGYLKSMALRCAIELGIPYAIHRRGGTTSLPDILASLPVVVTESKLPCVSRLMKLLAVSGIFKEVEAADVYHLTPVSRLLVKQDADGDSGMTMACCRSQFMVMATSPFHIAASQRLFEWLHIEDSNHATVAAETPFMMAHGAAFFGIAGRDLEFGALFNEAMAADSRFVAAEILLTQQQQQRDAGVFAGVTSLVDVGGGDGTTAKAIAKAFPHVRCSVLELAHVVDNMPRDDDGTVEFVVGDMMEFVPPADAVLLKKGAVSARGPKGKLIIIDSSRIGSQRVAGSPTSDGSMHDDANNG